MHFQRRALDNPKAEDNVLALMGRSLFSQVLLSQCAQAGDAPRSYSFILNPCEWHLFRWERLFLQLVQYDVTLFPTALKYVSQHIWRLTEEISPTASQSKYKLTQSLNPSWHSCKSKRKRDVTQLRTRTAAFKLETKLYRSLQDFNCLTNRGVLRGSC